MIEVWICPKCGKIIKKEKIRLPVICRCKTRYDIIEVQIEPGFIQKAINFSSAVIKDISQGMPRCTPEEIQNRIDICKNCELYKKINETRGVCTHKKCGCNITSEETYMNKLYWKSSTCPVGKW